jgi:hypothetical protein
MQFMRNTLIVVADLAGFKAFQLDDGHHYSTPRLELLEQFNNAEAREHIVEKVSDLSGRFPRSSGKPNGNGVMSDGERHNTELEQRKRCTRQLATQINSLIREPNIERCYLAASREINHPLLDGLTPEVRAKITINLAADLTKVAKSDLLQHFKSAAA